LLGGLGAKKVLADTKQRENAKKFPFLCAMAFKFLQRGKSSSDGECASEREMQ